MVWGARIAGIFFLADDYIDSGKMLDRIPGFKKVCFLSFCILMCQLTFSINQAATGEGVRSLKVSR